MIVQDDTGTVTNADSYISLQEFFVYHGLRGNVADECREGIEKAIVAASDYLDLRFSYVGSRLNGRNQTTEWPRSGACDRDGFRVHGIPVEVKNATAEYTLISINAPLFQNPVTDKTGREVESKETKVGPITRKISYIGDRKNKLNAYPKADRLLSKLLMPAGMIALG